MGISRPSFVKNSRLFAVESSKRGSPVHPGIAACIGRWIAALSRRVGFQNMHQSPPPQERVRGGGVPGATAADRADDSRGKDQGGSFDAGAIRVVESGIQG